VLGRVFDPWRHTSTWWTLTHLVSDVAVGAVTFSVVVALLATTVGLLFTVIFAIPAFWLLMVSSRGLAHMERSRASALLGLELPDPVPPLQRTTWWRRLLERAKSGARWKEVGYLLLLLPLGLLNLALKDLPVGTAYAVWTGIGAAGTATVGILALGEPAGAARIACICLIVIGAIGLQAVESH